MANVEVEVKAEIKNSEELKNKVVLLGGSFKESKYQYDILLDPPETDFSKTDQVLRIRNSNGNWKMDYKSPRLDNETKSRMEYSIKIDDGKQLKDIFKWMGFKIVGEIEKNRDVYSFNDLKISFDNITNLGNFIEVECMTDEDKFEDSKRKIFSFLSSLGVNETIRKDYLELMWERGIIKKE